MPPTTMAELWELLRGRQGTLEETGGMTAAPMLGQAVLGAGRSLRDWLGAPLPRVQYDEGGTAYYEGERVVPRSMSPGERVRAAADYAGFTVLGRGGFGAEPFSKVMEGGKPKRVYRGTSRAYDVEDPTKWKPGALYGPGSYHTENPKIASGYAETSMPATPGDVARWQTDAQYWRSVERAPDTDATRLAQAQRMREYYEGLLAEAETTAPNVRASYLDITRPFDADTDTVPVRALQLLVTATVKMGGKNPDPKMARLAHNLQTYASYGRQADQQVNYTFLKDQVGGEAANALLKRLGYDGITHIGGGRTGNRPHRVWINFDPKQEYSAFTPLERLP